MYFYFLLSPLLLVTIWKSFSVDCRPQGAYFYFHFVMIFQSKRLTLFQTDLLFPDQELDNFSAHVNDPDFAQLDFNSEIIPVFSNIATDTEPGLFDANTNDIFASAEDLSSPDLTPLVQNPSSCGTVDESRINDDSTGVPQLQARESKPSLCPPSTSPSNKAPAGEMTRPGNNEGDDEFDFNTVLKKASIPDLFRDDDEVCPSKRFGLSNIPVCDSLYFSPVFVLPGQGPLTLYDVYTCMFVSFVSSFRIQRSSTRRTGVWAYNYVLKIIKTPFHAQGFRSYGVAEKWSPR